MNTNLIIPALALTALFTLSACETDEPITTSTTTTEETTSVQPLHGAATTRTTTTETR